MANFLRKKFASLRVENDSQDTNTNGGLNTKRVIGKDTTLSEKTQAARRAYPKSARTPERTISTLRQQQQQQETHGGGTTVTPALLPLQIQTPRPAHNFTLSRAKSTDQATKKEIKNIPMQAADLEEDVTVIALRQYFKQVQTLEASTFVIGDTLGTGTFGRVRIVSLPNAKHTKITVLVQKNGQTKQQAHVQLPSYYALKMLKKTEILRLKQLDHIKSEKTLLSQISHPFITNMYASFQDQKKCYMLMEYVIGGELFSQLRKVGRFSNDASRFYAAEIVVALEYLHSKNIAYRDLKPENLLIDKSGHMKITDFGFAKIVTDRTWTLCGTPEYLAPEIIQSKGHGIAVDWWALGVLIYEMLAGYPPFYDDNPLGIYQKILAGHIEYPQHFDVNARDLVMRLLTADRTKRLGCLNNGAADIKRHHWFLGIDWDNVYHRKLKPPFVPGFQSLNDTSNFDKYPDSDPESDDNTLSEADASLFNGF